MNNVIVIKKLGGGYQAVPEQTAEGSGVVGFCGWYRLAEEIFRDAGEIPEHETIVQFTVTEQGIQFIVVDNK